MPKTGLKAFVYSFSVSLFAIIVANRVFWHEKTAETPSIDIANKNIVLFLKNTRPTKSPVKQIALNILPDIEKILPDIELETSFTPSSQPEIILADTSDLLEIPLETGSVISAEDLSDSTQALALTDVLYSPEKPLEEPEITIEKVYTPEPEITPEFKAPEIRPIITAEITTPAQEKTTAQQKKQSVDIELKLARNAELAQIPLQQSNNDSLNGNSIKIGNPQELNHVALNSDNIPIQSMKKELNTAVEKSKSEKRNWENLTDSPWLVAKSGGGAKNQLAVKEFANKSNQEINQALEAGRERSGVQIAADTVKNLIIPIPEEIAKDSDLTPKLAYPSSSEDAVNEKLIQAEIKQKSNIASNEKPELLTPTEEDVSLDVVANTAPPPVEKTQVAEEKESKKSIISALNSIFSSSIPKAEAEAESEEKIREKAIAKAQAKRSFKKRLAKTRPVSIMPTEIRLSFQPNRAEISGQTLRWVQAFATKAAEVPGTSLEIRIDGTSSMPLQQKRLNLLHNILTNKGVEYSQINTVFTMREPNSFILRTVNAKNDEKGNDRKRNKGSSQYIQW